MKILFFIFTLSFFTSCVEVAKFSPTAGTTSRPNSNNKNPTIDSMSVSFDRFEVEGTDLDFVDAMSIIGNGETISLSLISKTEEKIISKFTDLPLSIEALSMYELVVQSASGQTIYPIEFVINSNTITSSMIQDDQIDSGDIKDGSIDVEDLDPTMASTAGDIIYFDGSDWVVGPNSGATSSSASMSITRGEGFLSENTVISSTDRIDLNLGSSAGQVVSLDENTTFTTSGNFIFDYSGGDGDADGRVKFIDSALSDSSTNYAYSLVNETGVFVFKNNDDVHLFEVDSSEFEINTSLTAESLTVGSGVTLGSSESYTLPSSYGTGTGNQVLIFDSDGTGSFSNLDDMLGVYIDSSYNILIGTGAGSTLSSGSNNVFIGHGAGLDSGALSSMVVFDNDSVDDSAPLIIDLENDRVVINGDYDLESGSGYALAIGSGTTTHGLYVDSDTTDKSGGTTTWSSTSDGRLKDVEGKYERGLREILDLNIVNFRYKKDNPKGISSGKSYVGIIAQEVNELFPKAVSMGTDGYYRFILDPVFWGGMKAIQELHEIILKNETMAKVMKEGVDFRVSELEGRVRELERENALIKSILCKSMKNQEDSERSPTSEEYKLLCSP